MAVVIHLNRRIDAHLYLDILNTSILACDAESHVLTRLQIFSETNDVVGFRAIESKGLGIRTLLELHGENAHANEIGTVDTLEAGCNHSLDPEKSGSLCCPVATASRAIFLTR